ncbi:MAG: flagellar hook-associated protein FlgL [Nitrospirae bacterium]|nr:flagellar hook-associated protein FlgL [Nitrospirota bacterium]
MRITSFAIFNQMTRSLQERLRDMSIYSDRLSSGKKINKPSDDAFGMMKAMDYKVTINEFDQYKKNIDEADSQLSLTDTIMNSVYLQISSAKELATQGANGSLTAENRAAIAPAVANIRDEVMRLSQTTSGGRYIFSGYKTDTKPFDVDFNYQGDTNAMNVLIDRDSTMAMNVLGNEAFSVNGTTFMEILDDLTYALENDKMDQDPLNPLDPPGIRQALSALENAIDQITQVRADVGAKMKRLEDLQSSLDDRNLTYNTLLSNTQDTDIAETVTEITKIQVALESLRASGAKVISQSLLDFLN